MADRATFVDVGAAMREALDRAARTDPALTVREWRVLGAVVAAVSSWSKLADRVTLARLASMAFGVDDAQPWMLKRTREALGVLAARRIIVREAPVGRPPLMTAHGYVVGLPAAEKRTPGSGSDPDGNAPQDRGPMGEKRTPGSVRNAPQNRSESDPAPGEPPEESSEKTSEERATTLRERASKLLRRQDDPALLSEVGDIVDAASDAHGEAAVSMAIDALEGRRFRWPSDIEKALKAQLPSTAQPSRVERGLQNIARALGVGEQAIHQADCDRCDGTGWVEGPGQIVERCPEGRAA